MQQTPDAGQTPVIEISPAEIRIDYAADDSCQIQCWCRGHVPPSEFRRACELALENWDGRRVDLSGATVVHNTWRTVRASADVAGYGVCEFIHVESAPGRGAYAVTVLADWLELRAPADEPTQAEARA